MFSQPGSSEEKKLNWMYQGANSLVDREDYLLGKSVDKSLEQLNIADKPGTSGTVPKNHVEHECIPPSIRDYKQQQLGDQVDIQAKLQEDPLITIKKREEESRRQFLQNPVQIAKLQKALKKRDKKMRKSKKHKLDAKLVKKIKLLTGKDFKIGDDGFDDEAALDTILMHKFNTLRSLISEEALQKVLKGEESDSSSSDEDVQKSRRNKRSSSSCSSSSDDNRKKKRKDKKNKVKKHSRGEEMFNNAKRQNNPDQEQEAHRHFEQDSRSKYQSSSRYQMDDHESRRSPKYSAPSYSRLNDSDEDNPSTSKKTFGLVRADGTKIDLIRNVFEKPKTDSKSARKEPPKPHYKRERLTEVEKEKRRLEMLDNAAWREKERDKNIRRYKEEDGRDFKVTTDFDPNFVHKELLKSANSSSVESRIKSNRNNLQRNSASMNSHFSKR